MNANADAESAANKIRDLSIDVFWQQDNRAINQQVRRLLNDVRIVNEGREIMGLIDRHLV